MTEIRRRLAAILAADVAGYSALMEADEDGTIAALDACRALFQDEVARHEGRIVDTAGDSVLAVFDSVLHAVRAGVAIQGALAARNAAAGGAARMDFRIGINLGDVVEKGDGSVYGDGVNVAARLQALAAPGGLTVSADVHGQVAGRLDLRFADSGRHAVKNISAPVHAYRALLDGAAGAAPGRSLPRQEVQFCAARDGTSIAYALAGRGPPLVKTANWLNHLEHDWASPIWRHLLRALAATHRLLRYDARGNGLSDWEVEDISLDAFVGDLEAVVDAAGLERFPLLGISQGCAVSIAFAARHPERVSRLVLYGGFLRGRRRRGNARDAEDADAMETLIRHNWGRDNPAFRQLYTSMFMPDGSAEQMAMFNELQRISASPENAARIRRAVNEIDVSDLAAGIAVPSLVLHCRDDGMVPFAEGRRMAATIPDARFVALEGRNHIILEGDPDWRRFIDEVLGFLAEGEG